MNFDRSKFFASVRDSFGKLSQMQVNGLNRLLAGIESDPRVKDVRWAAYMLATCYHETASTFQPIHEYGSKSYFIKRYGGQTRKGKELGNDTPDEGYYYSGAGDVQLTGESNYEKAEVALRREYPELVANWEAKTGKTFDLTVGDQPDDADDVKNVMDPEISYAIMSYGMRTGMFTGKKLSDYIKGSTKDYEGARKIINGIDKKVLIAGYAENFEKALRASSAAALAQPSEQNTQTSAGIPSESATNAADPTIETKTTEVVQSGDVTKAVETIETQPKGDHPDVPPTQVSTNGPIAKWLFSGGVLTSLATSVWAFVTANGSVIAIAVVCITVLIIVLIFRGAITDAIRMQTAADPDKKNVS